MISFLLFIIAGGGDIQLERSYQDVFDALQMLRRADVRAELSMTRSQYAAGFGTEKERVLQVEFQQTSAPSRADRLQHLHRVLLARFDAISETLGADERQRLDELLIQYQALNNGIATVLQGTVQLSDEQLKNKDKELSEELRQMMWSFHLRSQRELQQFLTPAQRVAWKNKAGPIFEFQRSDDTDLDLLGTLR